MEKALVLWIWYLKSPKKSASGVDFDVFFDEGFTFLIGDFLGFFSGREMGPSMGGTATSTVDFLVTFNYKKFIGHYLAF